MALSSLNNIGFTITELAINKNFGFSAPGKAKEDIDAGFFTLQGWASPRTRTEI